MEATGTTELEGKLNGTQRLAWFLDLGEAQYMVVTPSLLQLPSFPALPTQTYFCPSEASSPAHFYFNFLKIFFGQADGL